MAGTGLHYPSVTLAACKRSAILQDLKNIGVRLAMDDFGTGYSSLSYLKQFPIDVLKIDQSFVQDIGPATDDNGIIVSAVIGMGNSLKKRVVAEGVEDDVQLSFLKARHCEEGQGFFSADRLLLNSSPRCLKPVCPKELAIEPLLNGQERA